ncbi:hypothetical protein AgCh_004053 [Apium graveolens]
MGALRRRSIEEAEKREEDEWELINDDGFVYKRNKRPRLDITAATSAPLQIHLLRTTIERFGEEILC